MTLLELYKLKQYEYKETRVREKPWKLLAMLLLSEKDQYEPLIGTQGEFYKKYKEKIKKQMKKVEKDFDFTREDIIEYIEKTTNCDNYAVQRIWYVYANGFAALNWGLQYKKENTPEEIYSEYYHSDDLKKHYDIEQQAFANDIQTTKLNHILDKIFEQPSDFYTKICEELTPEERTFIASHLENKSCMSCTNISCKVEPSEKIGLDEDGKPQGIKCAGWFNPELIGRCKILRKTNINQLK